MIFFSLVGEAINIYNSLSIYYFQNKIKKDLLQITPKVDVAAKFSNCYNSNLSRYAGSIKVAKFTGIDFYWLQEIPFFKVDVLKDQRRLPKELLLTFQVPLILKIKISKFTALKLPLFKNLFKDFYSKRSINKLLKL